MAGTNRPRVKALGPTERELDSRTRGMDGFDALELLEQLGCGGDPVQLGWGRRGEPLEVRDIGDCDATLSGLQYAGSEEDDLEPPPLHRRAAEIRLRFWRSTPGPGRWSRGTLRTMLVDRLRLARFGVRLHLLGMHPGDRRRA